MWPLSVSDLRGHEPMVNSRGLPRIDYFIFEYPKHDESFRHHLYPIATSSKLLLWNYLLCWHFTVRYHGPNNDHRMHSGKSLRFYPSDEIVAPRFRDWLVRRGHTIHELGNYATPHHSRWFTITPDEKVVQATYILTVTLFFLKLKMVDVHNSDRFQSMCSCDHGINTEFYQCVNHVHT